VLETNFTSCRSKGREAAELRLPTSLSEKLRYSYYPNHQSARRRLVEFVLKTSNFTSRLQPFVSRSHDILGIEGKWFETMRDY